jgi:hypothetical protein
MTYCHGFVDTQVETGWRSNTHMQYEEEQEC